MMIMLLPVVTLQLVVSVVFVNRHFEDVTQQMTRNTSYQIDLLMKHLDVAKSQTDALDRMQDDAKALQMDISFLSYPASFVAQSYWYDLTGPAVRRHLPEFVDQLQEISLSPDSRVELLLDAKLGPLVIGFDRKRLSAANPHQLFANMLVFGVLITAVAYLYLRNQLRPITRLAKAAQAFGRGRSLDYRPSGATEVREAGNAFLDMRNRIERQIEQRTLMLSGVSHDLRSPLTRLKLGLSMIEDPEVASMQRDVDEMQHMLDEFLSFARGASSGEPEIMDPIPVIRGVVSDCQSSGMNVEIVLTEGQGQVALNKVAIRRAVQNLISNATRYGTKAEVSIVISERALRIRVDDDGPGIPADQREIATRPFVRLDQARNQNVGGGVGLGLAIASDIARSHGGVLRLGESTRLGGLRADIVVAH